jgi:hypothetical protein
VRVAANLRFDTEFFPVVIFSEERDWQIASLDGYSQEKDMIIEIKCPSPQIAEQALKGEIPRDWYWQCQHQMSVSGHKKIHLCIEFLGVLKEIVIKRSEKDILLLNKAEEAFYLEFMLPMNKPILNDFPEDLSLESVLTRMDEIKSTISCLESEYEALKEQAITGKTDSFRSGNFTMTKSIRKGSIDYKSIPEIQELNLEPYRKPATTIWTLKEVN